MVCHGEHTYLFAQAMMSILAQEEQGGSAMRRIGQEVQKYAHERCFCVTLSCFICIIDLIINNNYVIDLFAVFRGHDASQITLALGTAAAYPRACQALGAMLSKGALNPADITVLFKMFSSMDPPPVELVRIYFVYAFNQQFNPKPLIIKKHKQFVTTFFIANNICRIQLQVF